MAKYVDGFVLVVPKGKKAEYKKMALEGKEMWMRLGALDYYECVGDDLKQMEMGDMKSRSFVEMSGAKSGDDVWFSFIVFKSKAHRDQVNAKVMKEMDKMAKAAEGKKDYMVMPFEMKKMAYGGFEQIV